MSRPNSALASITATYTDTDSEPEEDDTGEQDPVSSVEPMDDAVAQPTPPDRVHPDPDQVEQPMEIESAVAREAEQRGKKPGLVSYMSKEDDKIDLIDDGAIDDYDYYRDSREPSEDEEDESSKDKNDSPDVTAAEVTSEPSKDEDQDAGERTTGKKGSILPPPSTTPVSAEAQRIVDKMLENKSKRQLDLNKYIQANKSFRNPSIYEKLIEYCDLDELGTNYPPDVFNPHEWSASSYYDELAKVQKAEMDRREKARRERVKVEFVAGVVPKKTIPMIAPSASAAVAAAAATAAKLAAAAPLSKEPEKKKSKWDQRV